MTSDLARITELCRESAKLGLNVGMSDARPSAVFRRPTRPPTWMAVGISGDSFEWDGGENRHPVVDPAGAAALIAKYLAW